MGRKSGKRTKTQRPTLVKSTAVRVEHILVGVPSLSTNVTTALADYIFQLGSASSHAQSPYKFTPKFINGVIPVEFARNALVGEFLSGDYSRLWFIDADMLPRNSLPELLKVDADICAGRMFRFDHANPMKGTTAGVAICAMNLVKEGKNVGKYKPIVPMHGEPMIQDVDTLGTGSMMIRRRVLEDHRMWIDGKYIGIGGDERDCALKDDDFRWSPPLFRTPRKANGAPIIGEDLDFCQRAHDLGYSIKVHLGAEVGHMKPVDLDQVVGFVQDAAQRVIDDTTARATAAGQSGAAQ